MKKPWLKGPNEGMLFPLRKGFIASGRVPLLWISPRLS